ncbi:MAG: RNA methyltransferase [Chloroflexota bacterium]
MNPSTTWQGAAEMIRRVHSTKGRAQTGLYAIEGTRLVERAIRAGAALDTVLVSESFNRMTDSRTIRLQEDLAAYNANYLVAPDSIIYELTEGRDLGPILGLVHLPDPPRLDELVNRDGRRPGLFLAGIDIADPGNAGALVRTAHAAGATAFLAAGLTDPFHPRATRISRGSVFRLPILRFDSGDELPSALRERGIHTIATVATGGIALPEYTLPQQPTAVLMGNEGKGLPENIQQAVDSVVTIPMPDGVDSFAVNAAAAIVLYALQRAMQSQVSS